MCVTKEEGSTGQQAGKTGSGECDEGLPCSSQCRHSEILYSWFGWCVLRFLDMGTLPEQSINGAP